MSKSKIPSLNIEPIEGSVNLHFMSLLEYKREQYLCVIDNVSSDTIGAYVLDYAEQERVPLDGFLSLVTHWFYGTSERHPISVEIAKLGLTKQLGPIYKTFDTAYVSRIIGNVFSFAGAEQTKVKRRRMVPIPEGIEIRIRKSY